MSEPDGAWQGRLQTARVMTFLRGREDGQGGGETVEILRAHVGAERCVRGRDSVPRETGHVQAARRGQQADAPAVIGVLAAFGIAAGDEAIDQLAGGLFRELEGSGEITPCHGGAGDEAEGGGAVFGHVLEARGVERGAQPVSIVRAQAAEQGGDGLALGHERTCIVQNVDRQSNLLNTADCS